MYFGGVRRIERGKKEDWMREKEERAKRKRSMRKGSSCQSLGFSTVSPTGQCIK